MHCIGCGDDIFKIPSKRRSLCSDSVGNPRPQKQAHCACISLLSKQLQLQGISICDTTIDQENPRRMCKPRFTQLWNYQKLLTQLEKNPSPYHFGNLTSLTTLKTVNALGKAILSTPQPIQWIANPPCVSQILYKLKSSGISKVVHALRPVVWANPRPQVFELTAA